MPDLERRMSIVETKLEYHNEILQERRRQTDKMEEKQDLIVDKLTNLESKFNGYKWFVFGMLRTIILISTFFSAVGAAAWALVTTLYGK